MTYERKEIYSLEDVFRCIFSKKDMLANPLLKNRTFDGDKINMSSLRYLVFKYVSHKCSKCGLEGTFFAKERTPGVLKWHLNLYGYDKLGNEVMLTRDHIKPLSKGGENTLMNLDCLCSRCNLKKGNIWNGLGT